MTRDGVNLAERLASFDEAFQPKIVGYYVVPRGVEHRPRADPEAHVLLIEPRGTPNTGDAAATPAPEVEI